MRTILSPMDDIIYYILLKPCRKDFHIRIVLNHGRVFNKKGVVIIRFNKGGNE